MKRMVHKPSGVVVVVDDATAAALGRAYVPESKPEPKPQPRRSATKK